MRNEEGEGTEEKRNGREMGRERKENGVEPKGVGRQINNGEESVTFSEFRAYQKLAL